MEANKAEISRSLQLLFEQGDTIELRAFANKKTINGYYRQFDRLAADASQLNNELQAQCYVVLNPVQADLHDKRPNTVGACGKGNATADPQATCRRWLVIDCDPTKEVKGASATDEERSAAERLARQVYTYLTEQRGLPAPAVATSGNGYWLLFRLADFPNDASSRWVLRQLLVQLADQFDNQAAVVDRTTFSAAQLVKVLGTVARKGESTAQRPHRLSQLLSVPDTIEAVTWEQITAITGQPPVAGQHAAASEDNGSAWDITQLLADRGLQYTADREYITASGEQATRYELELCPFNAEHNDRSACLIQWSNGAVSFRCHHNGCSGRDWQALKQRWQLPDAGGIAATDIILPAAPQPLSGSHCSRSSLESYIDPPAVDLAAFYGPIGQIVLGMRAHTEAAPIAVLCCTLAYFGNAIGRRCFVQLDQEHFPKLYVALVGATGSGRKGTADAQARRILDAIDPTFSLLRHTGLTTGEGLLLVLDENRDGMHPRPAIFTEREFAAVLKRADRKGNTLSPFIRDAWDNEVLANSTKNAPLRIEDHHVSICAHVTPSELKRLLSSSDVANGFSNRFLWIYSRRADRKPGAVGFRLQDHQQPIAQLRAAVESIGKRYTDAGQQPIAIPFSPQADQLWRQQLYRQLDIDSEEDTQLTLMCSRQAQQVCRIALIYAVADGSPQIEPQHLQAACRIADFVWSTVDYVLSRPWWGDSGNVHDPAGMAAGLLDELQRQGQMMRRDISVQVFQKHRTAREINALRDLLLQQNRIRIDKQGKAEVWHFVQ